MERQINADKMKNQFGRRWTPIDGDNGKLKTEKFEL
jgi:hypothetical protein